MFTPDPSYRFNTTLCAAGRVHVYSATVQRYLRLRRATILISGAPVPCRTGIYI
jgi:hypothetical protein